ncbi:MAG: sugar ABC transporter substrate-binding protein [Lachnospiraceae bacterium]|nr:sugar ABC transporter substrate-binding protein [Lachnospiraceae bacterium]
MKKFSSILLVAVMVCSLLVGCSGNAAPEETKENEVQQETNVAQEEQSGEEQSGEGGYTIGCVIINDANTHCIAFADKFKEIVEEKGDKAIVLAANDDPELLLQCINDLMAAGVDGIVMESPNATAPVEALREAAEKGVVISAADVLLDIEESEGVLVSQTVSDNYGAGVLCANDLIKRLDGEAGTVCHIIYEENEAVTTRVQGFLDTIEKAGNIEVLEGAQPTPVTQEAEMALADSWASKYDEITAVFGGGGPIAIAFMRGLEAAGVTCSPDGGTYIYGVDGSQDEYACILDGDYTGTARQQPDELARIATEDVYTVLGGGEIDHDWLTYVDVIYVDIENVNDYVE